MRELVAPVAGEAVPPVRLTAHSTRAAATPSATPAGAAATAFEAQKIIRKGAETRAVLGIGAITEGAKGARREGGERVGCGGSLAWHYKKGAKGTRRERVGCGGCLAWPYERRGVAHVTIAAASCPLLLQMHEKGAIGIGRACSLGGGEGVLRGRCGG